MRVVLGSVQAPLRELTGRLEFPDWYFKRRVFDVNEYVSVSSHRENPNVSLVVVEECEDSVSLRRFVEERLGRRVEWHCPAPMPSLRLSTMLFFAVGLLVTLFGSDE